MTAATERLGVHLPIVLAPMGGGPSTVDLAAAVSNAGGLGSLAGGYLDPDDLRDQIHALRAATPRPFAVNLFIPNESVAPSDVEVEGAIAMVASLRAELGLEPRPAIGTWSPDFHSQLDVLINENVPVASFAFGAPTPTQIQRFHASGSVVVGTATNTAEALALEEVGCDLVCAQGSEAGGHHGSWLAPAEHSLIGTLALVPQICDAIRLPVIAAGGIVDGRGVGAALCLGAGAVQMGTAFMFCPEAGTALPHRQAVASAADTDIGVTASVTGRLARGARNRLMTLLADRPVPEYPVMNALTTELRRIAAQSGRADLMSLWCGQAAPLAKPRTADRTTSAPAAELVRGLIEGLMERASNLKSVADAL